jgi:hypothetical protein
VNLITLCSDAGCGDRRLDHADAGEPDRDPGAFAVIDDVGE